MDYRFKSLAATVLIHVALAYILIIGMGISIPWHPKDRMTLVNLSPEHTPPPRRPPTKRQRSTPTAPQVEAAPPEPDYPPANPPPLTPWQQFVANLKYEQIIQTSLKAEDNRLNGWRAAMPQGTGGAKVTRVVPPNLTTHTVYWPPSWSKGGLPIIAWGNGYGDACTNTSLPYAGFLGEVASHGYFIVAVGNDDIPLPYPQGPDKAPDGRPLFTKAKALRQAIDWAVAENSRAGSPYEGKLDTSKIAYMGHGCGGGEAMDAGSADPRTTTTVMLNSAARFRPGASDGSKPPLAYFDGWDDDSSVLDGNDGNFSRAAAAEWPMYRGTLQGTGHNTAFSEPDPRWAKAIIAWLDWQLKGDNAAAATFPNCLWDCGPPRLHGGWSRQTTSL